MCSPGWRSRRPPRARGQRSTRKSPRQIPFPVYRLWEHLMLDSPGSLNGVARPYSVPSRELRIALRDNSSPTHENLARAPRLDLADVKSPPVIMPTMTRADRQKTAPCRRCLRLSSKVLRCTALHTDVT